MSAVQERTQPDTVARTGTYRAAVVHDFTKPLTLDDVPRPELSVGQILVKVEASGLCHTDIHAAHGDWPVKPNPPFVPGHEGVGLVEALGDGVTHLALGQRVAVPWLGTPAAAASTASAAGRRSASSRTPDTGSTAASPRTPSRTPTTSCRCPTASAARAAPLTCAGVTTYKAVKVAGAGPSSWWHLRRRRTRPPGGPVREDRRGDEWRRSTSPMRSSNSPRSSAPTSP